MWRGSSNKLKSFWSHFYNQTTFLIDRKQRNDGQNISLNPFQSDEENQLGLQSNFRNQLFFNRGRQHFTVSYVFSGSELQNILSFGTIAQKGYAHQFNFTHKIQQQWSSHLVEMDDDHPIDRLEVRFVRMFRCP